MGQDRSIQRLSLWLMSASLAVIVAFYGVPEVVRRVTLAVERGRSEAAELQLKKLDGTSSAFRLVTQRVAPAVVNVSNLAAARPALRRDSGGGIFLDRDRGLHQQGEGSGFVVDPRGYILTNRHVVLGAKQVRVKFSQGTELLASIVGSDRHTDLAVLKVDADELVAAEFGDSDTTEVGDWVLAIGNPFGLEQSVTAGIISAKGRSGVVNETDFQDFLQTDAAINPGNSGGPLVDLQGHVVGVNSAIWSRSGGYEGIGFAIPSKIARSVVDRLIADGKVTRGWLGVRGVALATASPKPQGVKVAAGVVVLDVDPDSPAAKAAVEVGDVIVSINSRNVQTLEQLRTHVATTAAGSKVTLVVDRRGTRRELEAAIDEQPAGLAWLEDQFGLSIEDMTPEVAEEYRLPRDSGVLITGVPRGSPAARAGLRPGDIIIAVATQDIRNVAQFIRALRRVDVSHGVALGIVTPAGVKRMVILE